MIYKYLLLTVVDWRDLSAMTYVSLAFSDKVVTTSANVKEST
jgi:hypothetical protein